MKWIRVEDQEPPKTTFVPLWFWDGEKVHLGHYIGLGVWACGTVYGKVTHWGVEIPDPPKENEE